METSYEYTPKPFVNGDASSPPGTNVVRFEGLLCKGQMEENMIYSLFSPAFPLFPSIFTHTQGSCKLLSLGILHGLPPASLLALFGTS